MYYSKKQQHEIQAGYVSIISKNISKTLRQTLWNQKILYLVKTYNFDFPNKKHLQSGDSVGLLLDRKFKIISFNQT